MQELTLLEGSSAHSLLRSVFLTHTHALWESWGEEGERIELGSAGGGWSALLACDANLLARLRYGKGRPDDRTPVTFGHNFQVWMRE